MIWIIKEKKIYLQIKILTISIFGKLSNICDKAKGDTKLHKASTRTESNDSKK